MKNKLKIVLSLGLLIVSATFVHAQSGNQFQVQNVAPTNDCVIPRVDGERVPFPKANTKFELAENETYLLNGYLVLIKGKVYLKVDFNSQPWLATDQMVKNPFMLVNAVEPALVARYSGRIVQIAVVAHKYENSASQSEFISTRLLSLLPPLPISI